MSTAIEQQESQHARQVRWDWNVWYHWVLANAVGEGVGLGMTLVIGVIVFSGAEQTVGPVAVAGLAILAGTLIEGMIVGTAQWLVLRRPLQGMRWRSWALATALGACVAWTLGMIPSTFFLTGVQSGTAAPAQMNDLLRYGLAAFMGFVLGSVLGVPQWLVLRCYVRKAGWWVLANAIAWALGMVVVFLGIHIVVQGGFQVSMLVILGLFLLGAGGVVGAVHGFALIWLLQSRRSRV